MALGGNFRGLKALRGRLQTVSGGDPLQTLDFMKHLMNEPRNKPLGSVVSLRDAFKGSRSSLTQAGARAGSIFDPTAEAYKQNFSLDLGGGRYLPVPGTAAYGAEGSMYGPGEYEVKGWQSAIQDLAYAKNPETATEAEARVIEEYEKHFGAGRGSALRPYVYDPMGVPGFLSTSAEQGDPFVARVSKQWVGKVRSKRLREALMKNEDVLGMLLRQPTNEALYMKYRLDPAMEGTMDVAVPETISRMYMGDQDKDLVNSLLFDANVRTEGGKMVVASAANPVERAAAEEAIEKMSGQQQRQIEIWQSIKSADEIAKTNKTFELANLASRNEKFATAVANRTGVAVKRTAGGSIGSFSNALTVMTEHMVRDPKLMQDPELLMRLKTGLFDIRQAPISARKSHVAFDLESAMKLVGQLHKGIAIENPTAAADSVHSTMLSMARTLSPKGIEGPEYKYWASQGAEDIQAWAAGRSEKARLMSAAFTANIDKTQPLNKRSSRIITEAFQDVEGVLGATHGGRMAEQTASSLGMMSEHLAMAGRDAARGATGKVGKIFAEHGGAIAAGIGALAALGVAMTSNTPTMATFSRASGNRFRPEERIGVPDNVPGEAMPGEMAPTNPPRRGMPAQPGVRTALVAPMGATSDLTVRMRATDQSRAAETARQIAMIPGTGSTNVTVNYRDRTRLGSLRTREKIRGIMRDNA
jgi:hypothetical protein